MQENIFFDFEPLNGEISNSDQIQKESDFDDICRESFNSDFQLNENMISGDNKGSNSEVEPQSQQYQIQFEPQNQENKSSKNPPKKNHPFFYSIEDLINDFTNKKEIQNNKNALKSQKYRRNQKQLQEQLLKQNEIMFEQIMDRYGQMEEQQQIEDIIDKYEQFQEEYIEKVNKLPPKDYFKKKVNMDQYKQIKRQRKNQSQRQHREKKKQMLTDLKQLNIEIQNIHLSVCKNPGKHNQQKGKNIQKNDLFSIKDTLNQINSENKDNIYNQKQNYEQNLNTNTLNNNSSKVQSEVQSFEFSLSDSLYNINTI